MHTPNQITNNQALKNEARGKGFPLGIFDGESVAMSNGELDWLIAIRLEVRFQFHLHSCDEYDF